MRLGKKTVTIMMALSGATPAECALHLPVKHHKHSRRGRGKPGASWSLQFRPHESDGAGARSRRRAGL